MSDSPHMVIYDCNIHVQYLLNPDGPAGTCVQAAIAKRARLILSYYILDELREMPERPFLRQLGLTAGAVEDYISLLIPVSTLVGHVPHLFEHPVDRDDSHYIDLAIATSARLIVSRDRHMLGLMDPQKHWSADFRQRFPGIRILTAETFVELLKSWKSGHV